MKKTNSLDKSIQALYQVFRKYPARRNMPYCPCCTKESDIYKLFHRPLEQLTIDDMDRFIWKAMTTFGEVGDFKHFLPRILELLALTGDDFPEVFLVGSKLGYGKLEEWASRRAISSERILKGMVEK